jgi:hypothetical protein
MAKEVKYAIEKEKREFFKTGNPAIDDIRLLENANKVEIQPEIFKKPNEKVIENRHNSGIVLGRDYKYDPLNDTSIGMIDITAGRVANANVNGLPLLGDEAEEDKRSIGDFDLDAARIYLSQKTDIDTLFNLPPGNLGTAKTRSAVGIKADAVRLVSRDASSGIKLVVEGKDNSQGGDGDGLGGVDLIAGGGVNMQPIPKATDLAKTLDKMTEFVMTIESMVMSFVEAQQEFNTQVATELNISPFYGLRTLPDPASIQQLGKTSMDFFSYIIWTGRSLSAEVEAFRKLDLGLVKDEETEESTKIGLPVFASRFHKLD